VPRAESHDAALIEGQDAGPIGACGDEDSVHGRSVDLIGLVPPRYEIRELAKDTQLHESS
jgi:hypothetical protein